MTRTEPKAPGIPTALLARISHLELLLKHLPESLPLDVPDNASTYQFYLDDNDVKEEGLWYAINRRLEICFERFRGKPIEFKERGQRLTGIIQIIKKVAKEAPQSRQMLQDIWIEKLIVAAKECGAKIPSKRKASVSENEEDSQMRLPTTKKSKPKSCRAVTIIISDDDESGDEVQEVIQPTKDVPTSLSLPPAPLSPAPAPKRLRQPNLFAFGAKKISKEEAQIQDARLKDEWRQRAQEVRRREAREKIKKEERKQALNRVRQQRHRDKKKLSKERRPGRVAKELVLNGQSVVAAEAHNLAELSRPEGKEWKKRRNGKNGGTVQPRHQRTNYFHPFLWADIARIAPRVAWSATFIARTLQGEKPELYGRLRKGTVQHWISKTRKGWSKATLKNVERRHALAGSGRKGVLTHYPDIVDEIKSKLTDLRTAKITVTRMLGRSVILAIIQKRKPELLKTFKCSEIWVSQFFESVMSWTVRHGTRAAAHIPDDAPDLCERALFRIFHLILFYDIPLKLVINMDQTGILILLSFLRTYEKKGAHQVDIVGKDEKRAYTLCVATTADGDILPFQQVWSGKTQASLPSPTAPGYDEARQLGMQFTTANSSKKTSHFSTLKTMKEWMAKILAPYIKSVVEADDLPSDQKAILFIDCYPVHVGQDFRFHVYKEYPNVFLLFVPANCTGIFQPADVGIQRILKHHLRQETLNFLVGSMEKQIAKGLTPEQVKFTTSLPVLRDASVQPIVNLYNFFSSSSGREIIQQAWEKCTVKEFNLGKACLTGKTLKAAYREYYARDRTFREEIEAKIGPAAASDMEEILDLEPEEDLGYLEEDIDDDSGIPISAVVQAAVGLDINELDTSDQNRYCAAANSVIEGENGRLQAGAATENIWAYGDNGELLTASEIN